MQRAKRQIGNFVEKGIMNFLCFGDKNNKSILFIHGMASTAMLCYEPILKRLPDYYVILAEVDGHSERTGELVSLEKDCDEIEDYIVDNLSGNLYCLSGFSMGATMAVEIIGRGNVNVAKAHLDGTFVTKMGLLTKTYEYPRKSVALLKKYLPDIIDVEIEHMGHGQYLHEHSDEYASKLIEYLQS